MNILDRTDDGLLDKTEGFSHKIQKNFGISCFSIAKVCLVLGVNAELAWSFLVTKELIVDSNVLLCLLAGIINLAVLISALRAWGDLKKCDFLAMIFSDASACREINIFRILYKFRRCSLIMVIFLFTSWVFLEPNISLCILYFSTCIEAIGLYFMSCTPLPPQKSKVREWLESFKTQSQLTPVSESA